MKTEKRTRKAAAFARFAAANPRCKGLRLRDKFYLQSSMAMGICSHSAYMKLDENDQKWDEVCK